MHINEVLQEISFYIFLLLLFNLIFLKHVLQSCTELAGIDYAVTIFVFFQNIYLSRYFISTAPLSIFYFHTFYFLYVFVNPQSIPLHYCSPCSIFLSFFSVHVHLKSCAVYYSKKENINIAALDDYSENTYMLFFSVVSFL